MDLTGAMLTKQARAAELGIHEAASMVTCPKHGEVTVTSFVKHCPDELACGCRYVLEDLVRCQNCGWPTEPTSFGAATFRCSDGEHGCS
jgi:hypothetical protein